MVKTIWQYIQSFRPEQVLVTLSVLLAGVWASSHEASLQDYIVLAILAFAGHIFGYGINDLVDYRFDRLNPKHTQRISLVSCRFDRTVYLLFTLLQLPLILMLGLTT
jgi:4-hydroxybenzoate polyprenyltransferase